MRNTSPKAALAGRVWSRMFDFLIATAPERTATLARFGLTPNDSRALAALDADQGRTMRSLAEEWECDASNVTGIIDRLETMGLVVRGAAATDRRVKLVTLTPDGVRVKSQVMRAFRAPPAALLTLTVDELHALARALEPLPE